MTGDDDPLPLRMPVKTRRRREGQEDIQAAVSVRQQPVARMIVPPLQKSQTYMIFVLLTRSPSTPPTGVNTSIAMVHRARYRL